MTEIHGWTGKGWEGVRDAFGANFDAGSEVGAAFSAYQRGRKVADLWGGVADPRSGRPWEEDTIIPVFSTTKGATAMCANALAQEGKLDVDAPVVTHWPEFAANGKESIPVSHLLSHRAGLAWIDGSMTADEALAWDPVVRALARQAPAWEPGTRHGYHATTFGWLVGEVVRCISGMSVGTYFRKEIAEPLGLDFWIGLPEAEEDRVAKFVDMVPPGMMADGAPSPAVGRLVAQVFGEDSPLAKSLEAPGGAFADPAIWNTRAMHAAEVPSANGIGDARSIARMYAACLGDVDGARVLTPTQVERAATALTRGPDMVLLDLDIQFGLGFMVHSDLVAIGSERSFGHFGFGGSFGWADPDADLAMGYVMNRLELSVAGDMRSVNLIGACYGALG
jgi:CubicO group peptidase (beta-lactamase class C family)